MATEQECQLATDRANETRANLVVARDGSDSRAIGTRPLDVLSALAALPSPVSDEMPLQLAELYELRIRSSDSLCPPAASNAPSPCVRAVAAPKLSNDRELRGPNRVA